MLLSPCSENQRFIYESTTAVLDGKGIPWYKMRKLNGLLTTECMRHAVLNTICEATGVASSSDGVPDIVSSIHGCSFSPVQNSWE